jgi:hypothetical protein
MTYSLSGPVQGFAQAILSHIGPSAPGPIHSQPLYPQILNMYIIQMPSISI